MNNYVPHPRYGSQPISSGQVYSKDEIESAHWRYASLKYFPETAIPAEQGKQNYAEYSRKLYVDIEETCKSCKREFIFFALEQKYWFEELKFWVDSHCVKCVNCRKKDFEIKQMQVKYSKLVSKIDRTADETQMVKAIGQELFALGYIKNINKLNRIS
jgi:hypothetical protein